jgi:hypothetical protein
MVKDGRESELVKGLRALLTGQNKGLKSMIDYGVETPMLLCSNSLGTSACAYLKDTNRNHGHDLRGVEEIATRVQKWSIGVSLTTERNWHSFHPCNRAGDQKTV